MLGTPVRYVARYGLLPAMLCLLGGAASAADLADRVNAVVQASSIPSRSVAGIHVVSLATGETLYERNASRLFLPASNMKLFTTALALTRLGPDYRFETRLVREPSGDLVLAGSGDPSMSGRVYPYDPEARDDDPLQAIEQLADEAVARGLERVDGDIVGDDRLFVWEPYPGSWTADDIQHDYGAPVSALTLNDNTMTVRIRPGATAGDLARVTLLPQLEYFAIDNRIQTVAGRGVSAQAALVPGTRQLLLRGTVGVRSGGRSQIVAVDDPALFAATALYDALTRRGVAVRGRPVARHRTARNGPVVTNGEILAARTSPPLIELLAVMEKVSQNLHAELILRKVASVAGDDGSTAGGLRQLSAMLKEAGLPNGEWRSEDASGLARNDEVTPHALTHLLDYMWKSPHREDWLSFLPVGGEDGTLEHRLCCTSGGLVRAKTGSLARSIALSGYANSRTDGMLAFSILVNNFADSPASVRAWVDKIALALVE